MSIARQMTGRKELIDGKWEYKNPGWYTKVWEPPEYFKGNRGKT